MYGFGLSHSGRFTWRSTAPSITLLFTRSRARPFLLRRSVPPIQRFSLLTLCLSQYQVTENLAALLCVIKMILHSSDFGPVHRAPISPYYFTSAWCLQGTSDTLWHASTFRGDRRGFSLKPGAGDLWQNTGMFERHYSTGQWNAVGFYLSIDNVTPCKAFIHLILYFLLEYAYVS